MVSYFYIFLFGKMLNIFFQVHITQGDHNGRGMIISWVTPINDDGSNVVQYWVADGDESTKKSAEASTSTYRYYDYASGFLHHATIKKLEVHTFSLPCHTSNQSI